MGFFFADGDSALTLLRREVARLKNENKALGAEQKRQGELIEALTAQLQALQQSVSVPAKIVELGSQIGQPKRAPYPEDHHQRGEFLVQVYFNHNYSSVGPWGREKDEISQLSSKIWCLRGLLGLMLHRQLGVEEFLEAAYGFKTQPLNLRPKP